LELANIISKSGQVTTVTTPERITVTFTFTVSQNLSSNNYGSQSSVTVVSNQLVVSGNSQTATWTITVENTANHPITQMRITLTGFGMQKTLCLSGTTSASLTMTQSEACSSGNLAPGQSVSGSAIVSGVQVGSIYTVTINSYFADGSSSTNVFSVQATGS
jgi:hypothetical protein